MPGPANPSYTITDPVTGATMTHTFNLKGTPVQVALGSDMEMHPRPVDVLVQRPVGESYTGKDSQLDAAVRELLKKLTVKSN